MSEIKEKLKIERMDGAAFIAESAAATKRPFEERGTVRVPRERVRESRAKRRAEALSLD